MTEEEIFEHIKQIIIEKFEIENSDITPDAKLYADLDIDSLDAVDLIIALKKMTGERLDLNAFKQLKTAGEVAESVHKLLAQQGAAEGSKLF